MPSPEKFKEANACCKSGARLKASQEFASVYEDDSIEVRLALISERPSRANTAIVKIME